MTQGIEFNEFTLNPGVAIAPVIYQGARHQVTPWGATVGPDIAGELQRFVQEYAWHVGAHQPFFRIDVYPSGSHLAILEVNTCFVDGWGTAANLSRATGIPVPLERIGFPRCLGWHGSNVYLPELELLVSELAIRGANDYHICKYDNRRPGCHGEPCYLYGRIAGPNVWPLNGLTLDNKSYLATFGHRWSSQHVIVPAHYTSADTPWDGIPADAVLKLTDKSDPATAIVRWSVRLGKPQGKAKFLRQLYAEGRLIAQARVTGLKRSVPDFPYERYTQLVVLAGGDSQSGNALLAGYVQYAAWHIVTDDSVHGPLIFEARN